jgi:hypothetical protein
VEVFAWGPATLASGLASGDAAQRVPVRVSSPARTIADLMRMRHEVGDSMAHIALHRYLAGRGSRVAELIQYCEESDEGGPIAELMRQSLTDDDAPTEELARRQGISPVGWVSQLAHPDLRDSDEDFERFLAELTSSRRGDLG